MGDFWRETRHRKMRRAPWHDYALPGTYFITMVVAGRCPLFGSLVSELDPAVLLSPLGQAVRDAELAKMHAFYPNVEVWGHVVMPDHLHLILHVSEPFRPGKNLGSVIRGFKSGCNNAWWALGGERGRGLFDEGYNDGILMDDGQLEGWMRYIADNPRRLAVKRAHPEFFTVLREAEICGRVCQVVGNSFLLGIPDKEAVIAHRGYSEAELRELRERWLQCGERGGVIVSAAIAQAEKEVMMMIARERGYRQILLLECGFPPVYKPAGAYFDACSQGLLLQISPWPYHMDRRVITRSQCLQLNAMAEAIAAGRW